MSFGTGPFGGFHAGGYGPAATEEVRSSVSSSRAISFQTGRYLVNDEGGFEAVDDIAQTVALTVAYAYRAPDTITVQNMAKSTERIRSALRPMTIGIAPLISEVAVRFDRSSPGVMRPLISYRNMRTKTKQTVEARK